MSELPRISGREAVKALKKIGYEQDRQCGSHIILRQTKHYYRRFTVPDHRECAKGTLRAIIRETGLTLDFPQRETVHPVLP
ncbi:MAG TPA: type II toxin-antitoxin system HicA family toxin [Candidatus Sumerlaeota bacterium]|nr:type II toxin-antitoxin system HicA family toxin [Candidatus Sumerlaeota bacterium]